MWDCMATIIIKATTPSCWLLTHSSLLWEHFTLWTFPAQTTHMTLLYAGEPQKKPNSKLPTWTRRVSRRCRYGWHIYSSFSCGLNRKVDRTIAPILPTPSKYYNHFWIVYFYSVSQLQLRTDGTHRKLVYLQQREYDYFQFHFVPLCSGVFWAFQYPSCKHLIEYTLSLLCVHQL